MESVSEIKVACLNLIKSIDGIKKVKPNDRTEVDRRFAILITDLEKVAAYCQYYIIDDNS